MLTMKQGYTPAHYFAALKLLEQLCWDGKISPQMFRDILNDYAEIVDLSRFSIPEDKTIREGEENHEL